MVGASAIAALGLLVSLDGAPQQTRAPSITHEPPKTLTSTLLQQASPEQRRALIDALLKRGDGARVLCGLTLLPADPSIDASMSRRLADSRVDATIRKVVPTVCGGNESIR